MADPVSPSGDSAHDDATVVPQPGEAKRDVVRDSPSPRGPRHGAPEALPETPPVEVPNHTLVRCLGVGGFGQVWLGKHLLTDHYRACKLIHMSRARELDGLRRIKRDVAAHPGLVPIEEVGLVGEWLHCLMPLADSARVGQAIQEPGQYQPMTLRLHLKRHGRMSPEDALATARDLADAIEHLHRHGVMHGDIKPANVLRLNGRWALADYGLADDIDAAEGAGGTPGYVPPEGPGSAKADQYAFGVLIGEMVGGDTASPQLAELVAIAARATAERPEARFASTSELVSALSGIRAEPERGVVPSASAPSPPDTPAFPGAGVVRSFRDAVVDFWVAVRHGGEAPQSWQRRPEPVTEEAPTRTAVDADAIACANCGYALRGLSTDGRCPECALPVSESFRAAGIWNSRRLKLLMATCACLIAMLPAWIVFAIVPLVEPVSPTPFARFVVAVSLLLYAVLLMTAAVMSVHTTSRQARRVRYALIGAVCAVASVPVILFVVQLISPRFVDETAVMMMLIGLLASRTTLLIVVFVGMHAASRALSASSPVAWIVAVILTTLSALPWAFILFAPAMTQNRWGQARAAGFMMLTEAVLHAVLLIFVGLLIVNARRRVRSLGSR